ncbi:MAG: MFS transporter, partial [Armatimonadota bacterium]
MAEAGGDGSKAETGSSRRTILIALLVAGTFFMENLDGTVIATAIPQMARSFGASPVDLNIGITAYLLALAMFIPMSGWLTDRFGSRIVFGTAITVFTLSSVLCAVCGSLVTFTAARILQGIGGAMMVPVGRLVVLRNTPKRDFVTAIAYITWPGLVAPVLGPPLGGFITTYLSWRWIFLLNIPLGILALVMAGLLIPNEREPVPPPFDVRGFLLSGVGCALLIFGLDLVGRLDSTWSIGTGMLAVSVVLGTAAVRHFRTHPHPLVDLDALKVPTFAVSFWGGSVFRIAIGTTPFLLPLLFQIGFGMSAFVSGMLVLSVFAGNLLMKPATTPILRRFGFRTTLIGNGVLSAITLLACCFLSPATPLPLIAAILFVGGLCRSMQFTCLNAMAFADIPPARMSRSTTLSSTVQQMTLAVGVAFGAILLRLSSFLGGSYAQSTPTIGDFRITFALISLVALAAIVNCFKLPPDAGSEVSGHRAFVKSRAVPQTAEEAVD